MILSAVLLKNMLQKAVTLIVGVLVFIVALALVGWISGLAFIAGAGLAGLGVILKLVVVVLFVIWLIRLIASWMPNI